MLTVFCVTSYHVLGPDNRRRPSLSPLVPHLRPILQRIELPLELKIGYNEIT